MDVSGAPRKPESLGATSGAGGAKPTGAAISMAVKGNVPLLEEDIPDNQFMCGGASGGHGPCVGCMDELDPQDCTNGGCPAHA